MCFPATLWSYQRMVSTFAHTLTYGLLPPVCAQCASPSASSADQFACTEGQLSRAALAHATPPSPPQRKDHLRARAPLRAPLSSTRLSGCGKKSLRRHPQANQPPLRAPLSSTRLSGCGKSSLRLHPLANQPPCVRSSSRPRAVACAFVLNPRQRVWPFSLLLHPQTNQLPLRAPHVAPLRLRVRRYCMPHRQAGKTIFAALRLCVRFSSRRCAVACAFVLNPRQRVWPFSLWLHPQANQPPLRAILFAPARRCVRPRSSTRLSGCGRSACYFIRRPISRLRVRRTARRCVRCSSLRVPAAALRVRLCVRR